MLKRCRICGKERTADEQKSKYGKNPYFCVECNEKRLNRIGKQLESLVHNGENFEPKNYKQEIKAFFIDYTYCVR